MATSVRWGICGSGKISNDFAAALYSLGYPISAVAASSQAKADAFAAKIPSIAKAHGSYAAMAEDPDVDIVYVGTVHSCHLEHALLMINAGKHVLCEKPLTLNMRDTQRLVTTARAKRVFFLEGMWTRFFPAVRKVASLLEDKTVGTPVLVQADFGFKSSPEAAPRVYDPALGGGGLLDIGIYPVAAATLAFGGKAPTSVKAVGVVNAVDEQAVIALGYPTGSAALNYSLLGQTPEETLYICTDGYIKLTTPGHAPTRVIVSKTLARGEVKEDVFDFPLPENKGPALNFPNSEGFQYEAQAVAEAVAAGKLECPEYPVDETVVVQGILDDVRKELGVVYAADAE